MDTDRAESTTTRAELADALGLRSGPGDSFKGKCPSCGEYRFFVYANHFQCGSAASDENPVATGCGWWGSLSDLEEWLEERRNGSDPGPEGRDPAHSDDGDGEPTLTDTGNATRLVRLHGPGLHYIPSWGRWLVSDEGFWTVDDRDVRIRELAKDVGRQIKHEAAQERDDDRAKKLFSFGISSLNARRIGGMVDLARGVDGIPLDHEELDTDGGLLGVENGVVELETGRLRAADPADLMTMRCPVSFDDDAEAPRWHRALEEWFPDPDVRAYVHRVAGSALVGAQREHVFIIHYGLGGNGKGTFTRALQRVLGPYAIEVHLTLLLDTKYREHDTVKADLFRSRLAVAVETDRRVKLAEASVKNLTGGDRIRARRMREDPWSFDPTHSLWLQTNHLPQISGRDGGIWRRIRVVKWETTFSDRQQDRDLDAKLTAEAPGILRWLVEGCLEWQEHGLDEPEAVIRETLAYRKSEDVLSRFQEDMSLTFDPHLKMKASELQDLLAEWSNAEGIDAPTSQVGEWLHENGCSQKRKRYTDVEGKRRQARFWIGVGIDEGNDRSEQTYAL